MTLKETIIEKKYRIRYKIVAKVAEKLQKLDQKEFDGVINNYIISEILYWVYRFIDRYKIREMEIYQEIKAYYELHLKGQKEITQCVNSLIGELKKKKIKFYTFEINSDYSSDEYSSSYLEMYSNYFKIILQRNRMIEFVAMDFRENEYKDKISLNVDNLDYGISKQIPDGKKITAVIGVNQIIDHSYDFTLEIISLLDDYFQDASKIEEKENCELKKIGLLHLGSHISYKTFRDRILMENIEGFLSDIEVDNNWMKISKLFLSTDKPEVQAIALFYMYMQMNGLTRNGNNIEKEKESREAYTVFVSEHKTIVRCLRRYFQLEHIDLDGLLLEVSEDKFYRYFRAIIK